MTILESFADEIGLRLARDQSLGFVFVVALLIGTTTAWLLGRYLGSAGPLTWTMLASFLLWQPAIEELLFRGVLQGWLLGLTTGCRTFAGFSVANIITSMIFTAGHFINQPLLWALGAFFPSLIFGWFRDRSGSLWPPVLLHGVFNAAFFISQIPQV